MSESERINKKTLILCIDGDNDIGQKANIETPIISRDPNLKAATSLALSDPEEADANAMFGAVKLYDRLLERYPDENFEVATVAGLSIGGVEADRKIVEEFDTVLDSFKATGVILVTDGYADESLIPIVQSRVPITSIQHIVVKHSERIEETWAVFLRYLKMLVQNPYYSRFSLGIPGIMLMIVGVLLIFDQLQNAGVVLTFVLGVALLIKGFGWDEKIAVMRLKLPPPERQLIFASTSVGIIIAIVGSIRGIYNAWDFVPANAPPWWQNFSWWIQQTPNLIAYFLLEAIDFIVLGFMVSLIGGVANHYMQKDNKMWQNIAGIIVIFWIRFIAVESARVLIEPEKILSLYSPLVIMALTGILTTIASIFFIYGASKKLPLKRTYETQQSP